MGASPPYTIRPGRSPVCNAEKISSAAISAAAWNFVRVVVP